MKRTFIIIIAFVVVVVVIGVSMAFPTPTVDEPLPSGNAYITPPDGNETMVITHKDLLRVESLMTNDIVTSPLIVRGEARGTWYFEASFPVELIASDGTVLIQHYAQAQDEWMTENFVPFETTLVFDHGNATSGVLIIHKDNPSGLPEYEDELRIPVRFK